MTKSSASSVSSKASRPRRPPSPVSLYGAGVFGAPVPKQPRPLPQLEKKPKRDSASSHKRTPSTSTHTSHRSDDTASSYTASSGSIRSIDSLKNLGIPGWRRKRAALAQASSLPTTPNLQSSFSPSNKPPSHREDQEILRSESENLVRQLDKATRTLGERVPVEFIFRRKPVSVSAPLSPSPPPSSSGTEDSPVSGTPSTRTTRQRPSILHHEAKLIPELPPPPPEEILAECLCRPDSMVLPTEDGHDPDSPVLPIQDYHYVKKTPTLPPITTTTLLPDDSEPEEGSPILFSQKEEPPAVLPPPRLAAPKLVEAGEHPERKVPLLLRQPRPRVRSATSLRPATSHTTLALPPPPPPAAAAVASPLPSPPPVESINDAIVLKTSTPARRPTLVRPKTSHAGFKAGVEASPAHPRPESPFQNSTVPFHAWVSTTWSSEKEPSVVRQELGQGWSGEWNRADMQDVISQLRQLK